MFNNDGINTKICYVDRNKRICEKIDNDRTKKFEVYLCDGGHLIDTNNVDDRPIKWFALYAIMYPN